MNLKKIVVFMLVIALVLSFAACGKTDTAVTEEAEAPMVEEETPTEEASGQGYVIGFSNSYNGNTYRQTMEGLFEDLAEEMKADGIISEYKMLVSNNNVATQVAQIESLILDGVDAIIVDPGSAAGLNGAIEKADEAGIPVVIVNDGPITTDKCYQINWDTTAMATNAANYMVEALDGEGKVIIIQGQAGVPFNENFNDALNAVLSESPGIEIVGDVYGEWTESVTQKQIASILPGIPEVDGIIGQGGDGYGALQAFEAAGRDFPIIIGGNRGNFLSWWAEEKASNGYETFSWAANPWSAASGLYVAIDLLDGVEVPSEMIMPALSITQDMIDDFTDLAADEVAYKAYDNQWIIDNYYN